MKRFVEGDDRAQVALLPECVDAYVHERVAREDGGQTLMSPPRRACGMSSRKACAVASNRYQAGGEGTTASSPVKTDVEGSGP